MNASVTIMTSVECSFSDMHTGSTSKAAATDPRMAEMGLGLVEDRGLEIIDIGDAENARMQEAVNNVLPEILAGPAGG